MVETIRIEAREQYDFAIQTVAVEHPSVAIALDNLVQELQEAVQDQYVDAQEEYEGRYGWETSPEPFEEWLDHEFPILAMLPMWIFRREVGDGS